MVSNSRIIITTGDTDGIGWEVSAKALSTTGPRKGFQFLYFRSPDADAKYKSRIARKFKIVSVSGLGQALSAKFSASTAIEILSREAPAKWVEQAAKACVRGEARALVTGPLSKTGIIASGLQDIGHTEILARVSEARPLFMAFVGAKFSVVLATGHEPLASAVAHLNPELVAKALAAAAGLRAVLPAKRRKLPLALVGVNPHAGEDGIIGREEQEILRRAMSKVREAAGVVAGPLVPDAAFLPGNWSRYSVYVCPYHDQGLIPFKLIHGFSDGVHLTLGLPFVRTSVDHGTAKELFGKDRAEAGSMKVAIATAMQLCREKSK